MSKEKREEDDEWRRGGTAGEDQGGVKRGLRGKRRMS